MNESKADNETWEMVAEIEAALTDGFVTGEIDHPRLQMMLKELEAESEQQRIRHSINAIFRNDLASKPSFQEALVSHLCDLRRNHGVEMATLQVHSLGVYRQLRSRSIEQLAFAPGLQDLRGAAPATLSKLMQPLRYGCHDMTELVPLFEIQNRRANRLLRLVRRQSPPKADWIEPGEHVVLDRRTEERVSQLPPEQRTEEHNRLARRMLANRFYQSVFFKYLHPDQLDPNEIASHDTVADWLEAIGETPHLFSFMQGFSSDGKQFRRLMLANKMVQLCEITVRIDRCRHQNPAEWKGIGFRPGMRMAAEKKIPALELTPQLTAAALMVPFAEFVRWVHERIGYEDLALPADPR